MEHITQRGIILLVVSPAMVLLSSGCVALRFLSRRLASSIQIDDWVCLVSLLFAYGTTIVSVLLVTIANVGYHINEYTPSALSAFMKLLMSFMVTSHVSIALTKTSILIFYQRLFALHKSLIRAIRVLHVVVLGFLITAVCGNIFTSIPLEAMWKPWIPHRPTIGNAKALNYSLGGINTGLDFALLLLPQRAVWTMQINRRQRFLVTGVFLLGAIVCAVTIARLVTITVATIPQLAGITSTYVLGLEFCGLTAQTACSARMLGSDGLEFTVTPLMLFLVEMHVGIICACLPMFPSLFRHWRAKCATQSSNSADSSMPLHVSFPRLGVRRPQAGARAAEDSAEELNTQVDAAYQGASYYMVDFKPARVHTTGTLASRDPTTGSQASSR